MGIEGQCYNNRMPEKLPARSQEPRLVKDYAHIWSILAYVMLAGGAVLTLIDTTVEPSMKLVALVLAATWAVWYWLFVFQYDRFSRGSWIKGVSFVLAIGASIGMSWIHPAFLLIAFSFYGLTFASLTIGWAIPLVVMLSFALAWRIAGFSGGISLSSLPIFISFTISAFFTILLGLYIDGIIRQNREKQSMIEELEAARSELFQAERQAGMLEERQRLAGEIHDTLAQGFTSVVMHLEAAEALLENDLPAARQHIDQARQTARQSLGEARQALWALRPDVVQHEPLAQALQRVARRWSDENGLPAALEVTGQADLLPAPIEATLIRAAQEILTNVRKHAQARQVNLTLTYMEDEVILDVQDDGVGFDPAGAPLQAVMEHGYGLVALQERAVQLGGSLQIESAPGEGTTVVVALPTTAQNGVDASGKGQND
jgi:signal transduction histidine kinase